MSAAAGPQDLVERALRVATEPCVLWVTEHAEANLRWANNALITNGEMRSRRLTVTATAEVADGTAAGTVTQEIAEVEDVNAVVSAAEHLARASMSSVSWRRASGSLLKALMRRGSCCLASQSMQWGLPIWGAPPVYDGAVCGEPAGWN